MASGFDRLVAKRRRPPRDFIPGIGGPYYGYSGMDDSTKSFHSSVHRQQAPFKPGQTRRTQQLKRRTYPTPGSSYRRHNPRMN